MERLQELFIGIAGMIGAGKSTLATRLGELLELPVYYEPVADNAYLALAAGQRYPPGFGSFDGQNYHIQGGLATQAEIQE